MSDIEGVLRSWFSRNHSEKAQNLCQDLGFVLSSDIGAVRDENQDRVAAMYTGSNSSDPVFVVAASDGMGGMRDGGVCSSTALSVFFSSLVKFGGGGVEERALKSLYEANRAVFDAYKGNGGATLTAILVNVYGNRVLAHVGDTRIYSFNSDSVERHTADDSLVEVVGGGGRGLLQFVGMGEGISPKIDSLPKDRVNYAITTDGIHGMEEGVFYKILRNSAGIKQASDRLGAISRWLGGEDNSSSIILNISDLEKRLSTYDCKYVQVWDARGELAVSLSEGVDKNKLAPSNENRPCKVASDAGNVKKRKNEYFKKRELQKSSVANKNNRNDGNEVSGRVQLDIKIVSNKSNGE